MKKTLFLCICISLIFFLNCETYASAKRMPSSEVKKLQKEESNNMTMNDFLLDGETVADHTDISSFLNDMRITLSENDGLSEESDADTDEESSEKDELSENRESVESLDESKEDSFGKKVVNDKKTEIVTSKGNDAEHIQVDTDDWHLILVNKQNPIPDDYKIELVSINKSMQADARIVSDLEAMFSAAQRDDINLWICSAYRSFDRQTALFDKKIRKLTGSGMNYLDAYTVASKSVTVPGTSEHQLGLALDIVTGGYTNLDSGFGETKAGIWLKDNAYKYGFILRYPKDKENVTGIIYEPWHYRYVGRKYSKQIYDLGITLEEFISGDY